jgi:tetratricopeptide (TPR) repeat protein
MKPVRSAILFAMSFALASPLAVAEPNAPPVSDPSVGEARVRFQKGVQLFHEGSFGAALAEFQKAYQIAPSYRLLYNIAQVHYELHDYVSAQKAFKQYLAEGGTDVAIDRREQVAAEIQKLEGRIAAVEIATNVDGAEVRIDEVPVGMSPLRAAVPVNAGPRRISISRTGSPPTARNVTLAGGDHVRVVIDLQPTLTARPVVVEDAKKTVPAKSAVPPVARSNAPMWVSLAATGVLGIGTGVSALLLRDAKKSFEEELGAFPTTKQKIDTARSRMVRYGAFTDGLAAATVVTGALSLYFALSGGGDAGEAKGRVSQGEGGLSIVPTLGGVLVRREF